MHAWLGETSAPSPLPPLRRKRPLPSGMGGSKGRGGSLEPIAEQSAHFSNLQGMVRSVCVEPVGGCGMAGSEVDSAMIGGLHLVDDDVLHAVEFVGNDIKVKFVVHLQNHL